MLLVKTRLDLGESVQLFEVVNTAGRSAFVLAKDVATARAIARTRKHLKDESNGDCYSQSLEEVHPGIHLCMSAVRRAAKERMQGLLRPKGNFVAIGDQVFAPLNPVD